MSPLEERQETGSAPLVSVIVPCIDDTYLVDTLEALASQQAAPPFEVLVVNGKRGACASGRGLARTTSTPDHGWDRR